MNCSEQGIAWSLRRPRGRGPAHAAVATAAAAARKRARPRCGGGGGEPDRLSALPDCLLHVIMSSLKARQAVQTCVLSRRWRHLWRSVPCLDVDLDEFRAKAAEPVPASNGHNVGSGSGVVYIPDSSDDSSDSEDSGSGSDVNSTDWLIDYSSDSDIVCFGTSSESSSSSSDDDENDYSDMDREWEKFEDFTSNLMIHCNIAQLESFRLHIGRRRAPRIANSLAAGWLRRAMKYCTPDPFSQHKGLSSGFWPLKRLHLCRVPLDNRFAEHVGSVCRSLEDLELHNCRCEIQSVTSHSLNTLVLKSCRWHNLSEITSPTLKTLIIDGGWNTNGCELVIMAPAVTYLRLAVTVYHFCGGISTNEMPSIAKASIHLQGHRHSLFLRGLDNDQFKLFSCVSNVTSFELTGAGPLVLGDDDKPRFLEFMNLRDLVLGSCDLRDDFRTLRFFLQSSPNLKKLTLRRCKFPKYSKKKKGTHKLSKTSSSEFSGLDFMCENLKVEIIYKDGDVPRQLVKLLLRVSGNLSKSHIKLTKV